MYYTPSVAKKLCEVNAVSCDNHSISRPLQDDRSRFRPLRYTTSQNVSSTERQLRRRVPLIHQNSLRHIFRNWAVQLDN